ncbi:Hypothetical protein HVR_LOCUS2 [uncultured virus]|nr:Hypothetical protein HVR_LOCUS2 [uncultured virus]
MTDTTVISLPTISAKDSKRIDKILNNNDHPVYVPKDEITTLFDRLNLVFWHPISNVKQCSFCRDIALFHNDEANMSACGECMMDLENKEIDVCNPGDHPVSLKLRNIMCEWADRNHWTCISTGEYFDGYKVAHNICYVCHQSIANDPEKEIIIPTGGGAVAHYDCGNEHGFRNYFNDENYNDIFTGRGVEVEDLIADLDETPSHTPEISSEDLNRLERCFDAANVPARVDYEPMKELFLVVHRKNWIPTKECRGCTFCRNRCTYHNESLNMLACIACYKILFAGNINILHPEKCEVSNHLRCLVRKWVESQFYHIISANLLFNEYGVTYKRCFKCKKVIQPDEQVKIVKDCISHTECDPNNWCFSMIHDGILREIIESEQFGWAQMLENLRI